MDGRSYINNRRPLLPKRHEACLPAGRGMPGYGLGRDRRSWGKCEGRFKRGTPGEAIFYMSRDTTSYKNVSLYKPPPIQRELSFCAVLVTAMTQTTLVPDLLHSLASKEKSSISTLATAFACDRCVIVAEPKVDEELSSIPLARSSSIAFVFAISPLEAPMTLAEVVSKILTDSRTLSPNGVIVPVISAWTSAI